MQQSLASGASDFGMPDVMRIGGVSCWPRAGALAEPRGVPVSSHLFPEISAHVLAVTPTCHWLEYIDWASPILTEPVKIEQGHAVISEVPGAGISLNEEANCEMATLGPVRIAATSEGSVLLVLRLIENLANLGPRAWNGVPPVSQPHLHQGRRVVGK
jgi:hypothetical protein